MQSYFSANGDALIRFLLQKAAKGAAVTCFDPVFSYSSGMFKRPTRETHIIISIFSFHLFSFLSSFCVSVFTPSLFLSF
jgi:hypothetical protein